MLVLCTICARGGSKGLPNKALKLINNKPLKAGSYRGRKNTAPEKSLNTNKEKHA